MTLSSGLPPYDYAHGKGPFRAPNPYLSQYPIGLSGVLLEQAQFVITAESRRISIPDSLFNLYINTNIAPSGPYEPKSNGSTLGNELYPGSLIFVDSITDTRLVMQTLFTIYNNDIGQTYLTSWLSALYPNNASGINGDFSRRIPSQTGTINYVSLDVLGGSGVLFDVDVGEVMYNPFPHISKVALESAHSFSDLGSIDTYPIQDAPLFPAFQKTNGNLIQTTGREPVSVPGSPSYFTTHVTSGALAVNGFCLRPNTSFYLGDTGDNIDTSTIDMVTVAESFRKLGNGINVPTSKIFVSPTAQLSGIYRLAGVNKFSDFPTTTIESGSVSFWPSLALGKSIGYHVFDDCLWITDRTGGSDSVLQAATDGFGRPSGLAVLSPYTFEKMWVRYADQTPYNSQQSSPVSTNWSKSLGLIRLSANNIYRVHPSIQTTSSEGEFRFGQYNDKLDFLGAITSTSANPDPLFPNMIPLGGAATTFSDMWTDGSEIWLANRDGAGVDVWKLDSSFNYVNKYIFNTPSGVNNVRGAFIGGNNFLFHGQIGAGGPSLVGSGIFPVIIDAEGTDPYDNSGSAPQVGEAHVTFDTVKRINGAPYVGLVNQGEIMDLLEVTSSTHVTPGVYALVRWRALADSSTGGQLYVLRIEETATTWEIRAFTKLTTPTLPLSVISPVRSELLYMSY